MKQLTINLTEDMQGLCIWKPQNVAKSDHRRPKWMGDRDIVFMSWT